jgi:hypothetical protein
VRVHGCLNTPSQTPSGRCSPTRVAHSPFRLLWSRLIDGVLTSAAGCLQIGPADLVAGTGVVRALVGTNEPFTGWGGDRTVTRSSARRATTEKSERSRK